MRILIIIFLFHFLNSLDALIIERYSSPWHYKCHKGLCTKSEITSDVKNPNSLIICEILCGDAGALWPKPTTYSIGKKIVHLDPKKITSTIINSDSEVGRLMKMNIEKFKKNVQNLPCKKSKTNGKALKMRIMIKSNDARITLGTDESYKLNIFKNKNGKVEVNIDANTYFGARHALETVSQLTVLDDLRSKVVIVTNVTIEDRPVFTYRGVLIDSSRNFLEKPSILRTILGMSMSKLNTLHWHLTDSQSFPFVSKTWPQLSRYGAYSPQKVYTKADIQEIVEFGRINGVRVLPEMDAPAHVGEGWQWVGDNVLMCFKKEPWASYCAEPPCGQLNPTSDKVYEILEGLYKDLLDSFDPDIFHMGGDEINMNCWSSSSAMKNWITSKGLNSSDETYTKLWKNFQGRAYNLLTKANGGKEIPAILWTSELMSEQNIDSLDRKKYIIQIWSNKHDGVIKRLLDRNFRVIFTNYDALYLDCGFQAWIGEGNNWCSPFKTWKHIYSNSLYDILKTNNVEVEKRSLVLGAEVALWSEQVGKSSLGMKLWPRATALAERLWSNPKSSWNDAERRLLRHRERLSQKGIDANVLQPEWCLQNQGKC